MYFLDYKLQKSVGYPSRPLHPDLSSLIPEATSQMLTNKPMIFVVKAASVPITHPVLEGSFMC